MFVREVMGKSHVFTLTDGADIRISARETVEVLDERVSGELYIAQKMGLVLLLPSNDVPKKTKKEVQK